MPDTPEPSQREELLQAIAEEEPHLAGLETEARQVRSRLAALRGDLTALGDEPDIRVNVHEVSGAPVPWTLTEKVRLFRSLFRGREEMFPTRFVSKRNGKAGYPQACRNKLVRGVCELPRIKCAECPNQAFLPVDDAAVIAHLTGRYAMGAYPLLEDETCWFLAVDFDRMQKPANARLCGDENKGSGPRTSWHSPRSIPRSRNEVRSFFALPHPRLNLVSQITSRILLARKRRCPIAAQRTDTTSARQRRNDRRSTAQLSFTAKVVKVLLM